MRLPPALQQFNTTNLQLRILSAAFMAPIVLVAVFIGGIVYGAVLTLAVTIGLYEWLRMVAPKTPPKTIGVACALLVGIMAVGFLTSFLPGVLAGILGTGALFIMVSKDDPEKRAGWIAAGIPYMGLSGLALLELRAPDNGMGLTFYVLAVVWGTDIGAYGIGKYFGNAKLAPKISPNKTWAGLFGGIGVALVVGFVMALAFGAQHPAVALVLSPALAIVAQAGDLFESYVKRLSEVKESGDLIPGHGGVLDRIDGLVFAGVFAFFFQNMLGETLQWW